MDHCKNEFLSRPAISAVLLIGEVVEQQGERFLVRTEAGDFLSQPAESCLLMPAAGDRVLLTAQLPDHVYLLAVLARPRSGSRSFRLGQGVRLEVQEPGQLQLDADSGLRLRSSELGVVAQKATLLAGQFAGTVRDAFVGFSKARWVGDIVESSIDRVSQWFGASQRTVGGLDQTRAGSSEIHVDQVMQVHGRQVLISAEKLARIDGDQVHIG